MVLAILKRQIAKWMDSSFKQAMDLNYDNILSFLHSQGPIRLLDLGCHDGSVTLKLGRRVPGSLLFGVEIDSTAAKVALQKSIRVVVADLSRPLPFPDDSFDIIHANQVIEHVSDVDLFATEIYRVLRTPGYCVISTENGSSWHNVFAAAMGWQIFSLTNLSARSSGIGNPMALHRHEPGIQKSWTHKVIFNFRGMREFFEIHGFRNVETRGAGYYPLPAALGRIDVRHSHFLVLKANK